MCKDGVKGLATIEYAILIPLLLACVFVAIDVYIILYQRALIQNLAEECAQSLSMQWGYYPLPVDEIQTGVYQKDTYESREVYWQIKLWKNSDKERTAEEYIKQKAVGLNFLKPYQGSTGNQTNASNDSKPEVKVKYKAGLPSTLNVSIKASYLLPGAGLMKTIGLGELLTIEGNATANVFDSKDMINNTDYVIQLLMGTNIYKTFTEKLSPIKEYIDKLMNQSPEN